MTRVIAVTGCVGTVDTGQPVDVSALITWARDDAV